MTVKRIEGEIVYFYQLPNGKTVQMSASQIFHFNGPSLNGLTGLTPIAMAKEAIGLGLATEEFGSRFFSGGASVSGVLETTDELGAEGRQNLRESVNEMHNGLSRSHRLLILEQGMSYKQMGIPPDQAQFLETRKFQVTEIARFFRVPPHMIYDLERATFSNIEQQSLEFVKYTLLPWIIRVEQAISWKLLNDKEKKKYFVEFSVDGLLRGDMRSRFEAYHIARMDGVITADEIRAKENWNPLTPEQLANTWRPVNMVPGDTPVETQIKHPAAHTPTEEPPKGGETT
jgi:HK97 family phage portal protein